MLSIMGWKTDRKDYSDRTIANSFKLDPKKTCVFFMIFNLRMAREEAALKWLAVYEQQGIKGEDYETFLMMFSLISKTVYENVSTKTRTRIETFVDKIVKESIENENFSEDSVTSMICNYLSRTKTRQDFDCPAIRKYTDAYEYLVETLSLAQNNESILDWICTIVNPKTDEHNAYLKHYMDIFVSSSPSYILMDGISSAIYSVKEDPLITKPWADALRNCRDILKKELQHLKMFDRKGIDPSKLVIISGGVINGNLLSDMLRSEKVEIEASFDTHIIAMTGIGDTYSSLERFTSALIKIDRSLTGKIDEAFDPAIPGSGLEMSLNISKAVTLPRESVPVRDSIGRVSSSYVFKYPPGIPILIPGQKITADRADLCGKEELEVLSNPFN